ncbi:MAG: FAD-dependent oxidoreductase, partial [Candidatus Woesearchaeota archaeon]|nr:FAD-dependent oxidoreductase [Candidatus Woesearchaeota archaeon]
MKKEVIVIGCGPAGLSAAIYLGRANIDTLVLGKQKDSQVMKAH